METKPFYVSLGPTMEFSLLSVSSDSILMKLLVSLKMVKMRISSVIKQHRKCRKHEFFLISDHTSQTLVLQTVFIW